MVAAAAVMLVPAARRTAAKWVALIASLVVLTLAVFLAVRFDTGGPQYQFVESHRWIPSFGTGYILGVDGIALALVVLTAALVPLLIVAGWHDADDRPGWAGKSPHIYLALILATEGMVVMSLIALDVLLFYVFFEAMLIPMYFLIGGFGRDGAGKAAVKFLLYNLFGGLIMLAAVVGLYVVTAHSSAFAAGTFDFRTIVAAVSDHRFVTSPAVGALLFGGFVFAFAIKAPLWPLHRWLPDAAVAATPSSAVLMMAVMDKVGTFGMLRYCLQLFPDPATRYRPLIATLAVIGILYGAVVAIGQKDLMRLIAYTSISHFGFIILGIFAMTSQSQAGATLYMVNHGIATAALFLLAGFLVTRTRTRAIDAHGGVQYMAPMLAGTFLLAGLATLSLPGLAPFISEFLVLIGTFLRYPAFAVFAAFALVASAVYILWTYQRMMTGPIPDGHPHIADLRPRELAVVAPLIALLLVLGIYPKPALDIINPAVHHTLTTIGQHDPAPTATRAATLNSSVTPAGGSPR
jgi:NADH-quinone oxidoreductase subunit M